MKIIMILAVLIISSAQSVYARPKNLNLSIVKEKIETVDVGAPGPSLGDISVNSGKIYDAKTNQLLGGYLARRITLSSDSTTGEDKRDNFDELSLPGGKVYIVGVSIINTKMNVPAAPGEDTIVGGTGRYAGVRGRSIAMPVDMVAGLFFPESVFDQS